ncbi:MAG: carboxypeptidase-like regulatory domain-containing protein, partial [Mucilaginibacter sp.]
MKKVLYYFKFLFSLKIAASSTFMILLSASLALAQTAASTIRGTVSDSETNDPLPGVTVKSSNTVVATDIKGNYSISAASSSTLVFSYIGYKSQEVPVGNQVTINIKLQPSAGQLKDVVVTALGIKRERRALGYSVTEVKGATLTEARE